MLLNELLDLYEGKKPKKEILKPSLTIDDQISKFERNGGKIIGDIKKGNEIGKIGEHNKGMWNQVIIVFYPDGTYERFDHDSKVTFKPGWVGIEIDSNNLKQPEPKISEYQRRIKEYEKNKKEYEKFRNKRIKKFNYNSEQASKWLSSVDIDSPENKDIKKFLQKKNGVIDAMNIVYQVILNDTPEFESESLNNKLKTVLDHDYLERFGHITKTEKNQFMQLPGKFQKWAAASVLI